MQARSILGGLAVALAAAAPPASWQDDESSEQEDLEEVLDELVERAGEIESYRAVYRVEEDGEEKGTIEFFLDWPDRGRFSITGGDDRADWWAVEGILFFRVGEDETLIDYRPVQASLAALDDVVHEEFFRARPDPESSPGVNLRIFSYREREDSRLDISVSWTTRGSFQLPWLLEMKRRLDTLELDQDALVCHVGENWTIRVSPQSGFPDRMEGERDGEPMLFELSDLEVDVDLPEELFDLPGFERDEEFEESMRRFQASMLKTERARLYLQLSHCFDSGEEDWDEGGLRRVFEVYHEEFVTAWYASWLTDLHERIDEFGAALAKRGGEDAEETEQGIDEWRERLRDTVTRAEETYCDLEAPELSEDTPTTYLDDLLAIDVEAAGAVFGREVTEHLLEYLDEVVEANRAF